MNVDARAPRRRSRPRACRLNTARIGDRKSIVLPPPRIIGSERHAIVGFSSPSTRADAAIAPAFLPMLRVIAVRVRLVARRSHRPRRRARASGCRAGRATRRAARRRPPSAPRGSVASPDPRCRARPSRRAGTGTRRRRWPAARSPSTSRASSVSKQSFDSGPPDDAHADSTGTGSISPCARRRA